MTDIQKLIERLHARPQTEPFYRDGIYLEGRVPTVEALAADALGELQKRVEQQDRAWKAQQFHLEHEEKESEFQQGRAERAEAALKELQKRVEELLRENAAAINWNHSVRVCKDHTTDIVGDGECVICALEKSETDVSEIDAALKECMKHADAMEQALGKVSAWKFASVPMAAYRQWKAGRE